QGLGTTALPVSANVATVTEPYNPANTSLTRTTTYVLNSAGQIQQRTAPDGTVQSWQHDFAGNLVRYTDQLGRATTFTYNYRSSKGDLTKVTRPDGSTLQFQYDSTFHHVSKMTDSLGRVTTYLYNSQGDLSTQIDALNQRTTYTYYTVSGVSNGLVKTITDPR